MMKRNVLTKVYVEGIARNIKGLKMGREGHPSTEGRTRRCVSGNKLRVNMSSEWQGK